MFAVPDQRLNQLLRPNCSPRNNSDIPGAARSSISAHGGGQGVSRLLVHLVDDDDAVRTSVARLLRLGDYDVREYASGLALIDAADDLDEGCILIDFNMPGANGAEVIGTLRDRAIDLPVIIMTGATTPSVSSPEPGIVGFIQKPFRRAELVALLDQVRKQP